MDLPRPDSEKTVCGVIRPNGKPCQSRVKPGSGPCMWHARTPRQKIRAWAANKPLLFILAIVGTILTAVALVGWSYDEFFKRERPLVEISNASLGGPLSIDDHGLSVMVTTPLQNTSNIPAVTAVDSKLFLVTDQHPKPGIIKAQDELCDDLQQRVRNDKVLTRTLFHGPEPYPMTTGVSVSAKELDGAVRKLNEIIKPPDSPDKDIEAIVISCVVYKSVFGRTFYRSAYANMIMKPVCGAAQHCSGGPVPFRPGVINPEQLMFVPSFEAEARVE
jgi:hypothetical protein